jgi:subtilisin family serine protease
MNIAAAKVHVAHIESFDKELKIKYPEEKITRKKLESIISADEPDSTRTFAFYSCWFPLRDTNVTWEQLYDKRHQYVANAEKEFSSAMEKQRDERSAIGDDRSSLKDCFYGNAQLSSLNATHGTQIAGIIGAVRDNGIGINGVADSVALMLIRAIPFGDEYDKDVALAIKYAVDNGANIINMGFGKKVSIHPEWVADAMAYAEKKNVLIVHAAGDMSANIDVDKDKLYPNATMCRKKVLKNFITVGASSVNGSIMRTSNYGKSSVDIFAPGEKIYATAVGDNYKLCNGTGMASALVTGIAAMVMSYYPNLKATQVKNVIVRSAVAQRGEKEQLLQNSKSVSSNAKMDFRNISVGGGIVSAYEAMKLAEEATRKNNVK